MTSYTGTLNGTEIIPGSDRIERADNTYDAQNDNIIASIRPVITGHAARLRRDRKYIITISVLAIVCLFTLIGLRAYGASIQHENNELVRENQYLQAEIDGLKSRIIEETKVTRIEQIATEEYGMVHHTSENCVRLGEDGESTENLAGIIRSEAYN